MTLVTLDFRIPASTGTPVAAPAGALWEFSPSALLVNSNHVVLPDPFVVQVVAGVASVTFTPSVLGSWYWVGRPQGLTGLNNTRYFHVPDTGTTLPFYAETGATDPKIVDIDPDTYAVAAVPSAAWDLALGLKVTAPLAPADGQLIRWSSTLGAWEAANPSGSSELAAAYNVTGTVTTLSATGGIGATVDIPGTAISVPNSNGRPVTIHWGAVLLQTAVGDGSILLQLVETTSGTVLRQAGTRRLPNATAAQTGYSTLGAFEKDIGVVTTTRTFKLNAFLWSPAANNPTVNILNTATNPSFNRAVAG